MISILPNIKLRKIFDQSHSSSELETTLRLVSTNNDHIANQSNVFQLFLAGGAAKFCGKQD